MCFLNKKNYKLFCIIRIIFYISLYLTFIIIPSSEFINSDTICFSAKYYDVLCPCCGVTRAFSLILHLDFEKAFNYNPIFVIAIFPIFTALFINDTVSIIRRLCKKEECYSIFEYLFNEVFYG